MKSRATKKRELEEKRNKMTVEEQKEVSFKKELRNKMKKKIFEFMDKSVQDEINEMKKYGPYCKIPEFVNPWTVDDTHGVSNDIAIILAALED